MTDARPSSGFDPAGEDRREELLEEYVDRLNSGERIDPQDIRREHPAVAGALIEALEAFAALSASAPAGRLAEEPQLGKLGDYTLRRRIGRGGMGVVYDAWQGSLDRRVALKVLPAGVAADSRAFLRFMREAKTAAQLHHPNVVAVYGMGVEAETPWFAMEMVDGETLAELLRRGPPAPEAFQAHCLRMGAAFADVADGLQHAHSKGVVHRDIKPSNLILDSEGRLRILDFGLARLEG
ncbi:MAG: serine/threonine protein kinase, partial [Planctomycetes bacterium]|nr:serine/threonine protein kinase [Planctomycetota bacterium]